MFWERGEPQAASLTDRTTEPTRGRETTKGTETTRGRETTKFGLTSNNLCNGELHGWRRAFKLLPILVFF